jgi:hypothetical protein
VSEHEGVSDATKVYVIEALRETRHTIYGELATIGAKVELAAITATREHTQVDAKLDQLLNARLESRVTALEQESATEQAAEQAAATAVDRLRVQQRWFAGFFVAAIPVALLLAKYIH